MTKIVSKKRARPLAQKFKPVIYQEWKSIKDSLTGMVFDIEKNVIANLPALIENPKVYYLIREDNEYYYAFYMLFHPFDWSSNPIKFLRLGDSHQYDTEACCFRSCKKTNKLDVACIFHNEIKFEKDIKISKICVETEGHGIYPYEERKEAKFDVVNIYRRYKLVNLAKYTEKDWSKIKKMLGGVKIPHQHTDGRWLRSGSGVKHRRGDMYLRPDKLFKKAEKRGRL